MHTARARIDAVKSDGICITRRDAFRSRGTPMGIDEERYRVKRKEGRRKDCAPSPSARYTQSYFIREHEELHRSTFARSLPDANCHE